MRFLTCMVFSLVVIGISAITNEEIDQLTDGINAIKSSISAFKGKIDAVKREKTELVDLISRYKSELTEKVEEMKTKTFANLNQFLNEDSTKPRLVKFQDNRLRIAKNVVGSKVASLITAEWNNLKMVRAMDQERFLSKNDVFKVLNKEIREHNEPDEESKNRLLELCNMANKSLFETVAPALPLLAGHIQSLQFNEQEKCRTDGSSGVKKIKEHYVGEKNYYSSDHSGLTAADLKDVPHKVSIVGMGQMAFVLNGIEFLVTKNEYELRKPSKDSELHATNRVPLAKTPSLNGNVQNQIEEMRKYFKAFQEQDLSVANYKSYFKPVITIMEGAWMSKPLDDADREKVYFKGATGLDVGQSFGYNPAFIKTWDGKGKPHMSVWNYRIITHQLSKNIPTGYFRAKLDYTSMMRNGYYENEIIESEACRFDLEGVTASGTRIQHKQFYSFLDLLMEEIPGKDNYGGMITSDEHGTKMKYADPKKDQEDLNVAYYHRVYKALTKTPSGDIWNEFERTYSDRLYVAETTQTQVSGVHGKNKRMSYAVPIEIIYKNPLESWNPFNIKMEENCESVSGEGSKDKPFSAACPDRYFLTPESFFSGGEFHTCADDSNGGLYFHSPNYEMPVCVVASGIRTLLPNIPTVGGRIRQRYPIYPVHTDGSALMKELTATVDRLVKHIKPSVVTLVTGMSTIPTSNHVHKFRISVEDYTDLRSGLKTSLEVIIMGEDHTHSLTIKERNYGELYIAACDTGALEDGKVCSDKHYNTLKVLSSE